jgi:hypothetical protein
MDKTRYEQITEEYHELVLQIAKSNYAPSFLNDIDKFCEKYFTIVANESLKWQCRSMTSFILEENRRWEEVLIIAEDL